MSLPYKAVDAFELDGELYPSEADVLRASIQKILGNPGMTSQVIREACDLAPLIVRACELGPQPEPEKGLSSAGEDC